MTKKPEIAVHPVGKYNLPKYPSHRDPNPLLHAPEPYPFHREAAAIIAAVGLGGCIPNADAVPRPAAKEPVKAAKVVNTTKVVKTVKVASVVPQIDAPASNPLPLSKAGLPHRTSPYGTGAPSFIDDKVAQRAIHRIFGEEGFNLKRHKYQKDGVAFVADGYDPERRIGFVWAGWKKLGGDAIERWSGPAFPDDDDNKLSYTEAKALEATTANKQFIAVISAFDQRFQFNSWAASEQDRATLDRIQLMGEPEQAEAYRAYRESKAKGALENLERSVREYIAWARSQGL